MSLSARDCDLGSRDMRYTMDVIWETLRLSYSSETALSYIIVLITDI